MPDPEGESETPAKAALSDTMTPGRSDDSGGGLQSPVSSYPTPARRQALRNLIGLIVCTGLTQACTFGTLLLLTHGLSKAAFGAVVFGLNLQAYLITFGNFGLLTIVVRDLTQQPRQADQTATAFLTVVVTAAGLAGAVTAVVVGASSVSPDERVLLWCVAAGSVFACLNLGPLFDAAHRQSISAALLVPPEALAVCVIAAMSAAGVLSLPGVGFVILGKWVLAATLQLWGYRRAVRPIRWAPARARVLELASSGWPILLAGLLAMIPLQGGVVAIRLLQGEKAAAVYGLAVQVAGVYLSLTWLVARVINPYVCGPHGTAAMFIRRLIAGCVVVFGGLWAAGVAGGWVLTRYILPADYREAFGTVVLLLTVGLLTTPLRLGNAYLTRFGRERLIPWLYSIAAAVYVLGVWALTPATPFGFGTVAVVALALAAVASVLAAVVGGRSRDRPND